MADQRTNFDECRAYGSAWNAFAITPADDVAFPVVADALYIGGDGDVAVRFRNPDGTLSAPHVFYGLKAGSILPVRAAGVDSSDTTPSTNLLGLICQPIQLT